MAFSVIFNQVNVNGQSRNGAVGIGVIQQNGWSAHAKQVENIAYLFGLNYNQYQYNNIIDTDYVDSPIADNSAIISGPEGQAL